MKITRTKRINQQVTTDIICNICGQSFYLGPNNFEAAGGTASFSFGYGSIYDDLTYKIDICDSCFSKFKKSLKHEPVEVDHWAVFKIRGPNG